MKKLLLALALVITTVNFAQKKERNAEDQLSKEQKTVLLLKKMTLELELTEKQQKELKPILLEQATERAEKRAAFKAKKEKGEKLSKEERFSMANERLDNQIALKNKLKKILTPEQMTKMEAMKSARKEKGKKRHEIKQGKKKE